MVSLDTAPGAVTGLAPGRRRGPRRAIAIGALVAAVATGTIVLVGAATTKSGPPPAPPASLGIVEDRLVPASVLGTPLLDQTGRTTSLSAFAEKIVVVTPFLSSCQETCPLTTGAFLDMQRDVRAAGLGAAVVFVEASIDPGRDRPARLAAYARITGVDWPLLTGTPDALASLWRYFGVYYQQVPENSPPGIDWQTGQPYTYDVNHSDGFIVIDGRLHVRFVTGAAPNVGGQRISRVLRSMLSTQGRQDLANPARDAWTVPEALRVIGWVAGRQVPPAG